MNANIVKTQLFYKIKYDLKGHSRSQTTTLLFKNSLFLLCYWLIEKQMPLNIMKEQSLTYTTTTFALCFYLNLCFYGQLFVFVFIFLTSMQLSHTKYVKIITFYFLLDNFKWKVILNKYTYILHQNVILNFFNRTERYAFGFWITIFMLLLVNNVVHA